MERMFVIEGRSSNNDETVSVTKNCGFLGDSILVFPLTSCVTSE